MHALLESLESFESFAGEVLLSTISTCLQNLEVAIKLLNELAALLPIRLDILDALSVSCSNVEVHEWHILWQQ